MRDFRAASVVPLFLATLVAASPAASAQDITGQWQRGDGNARINVAPCGQAFCATNTWIKDPNSGEKVGHVLVMNIMPAQGPMMAGTAYDPQRKLTISANVSISDDAMTTRGCILGGLLCRSVNWTRIK